MRLLGVMNLKILSILSTVIVLSTVMGWPVVGRTEDAVYCIQARPINDGKSYDVVVIPAACPERVPDAEPGPAPQATTPAPVSGPDIEIVPLDQDGSPSQP